MKLKLAVAITAVFLGGAWSGYTLRYVQVGMFGYDPCWSTLVDISREAKYQERLGADGWNFENPKTLEECVEVKEGRRWHGYRKP